MPCRHAVSGGPNSRATITYPSVPIEQVSEVRPLCPVKSLSSDSNRHKIVRMGYGVRPNGRCTNWAHPVTKEHHMSRIRTKRAIAAVLVAVASVSLVGPVAGSVDAGKAPSKAILRAIL
jgi:hypothetical protein